jgi:hypothetical protein
MLTINSPKKQRVGVVDFIDGVQVVKLDGIYYPIVYKCKGVISLYSLPNNNKHEPYTKKANVDIDTLHNKDSVLTNWSPFKKGKKVIGVIRDNKFHVI